MEVEVEHGSQIFNSKIKILGISCGPRRGKAKSGKGGSRSEKLLLDLMDRVKEYGGVGEFIRLADQRIDYCEGCYSEDENACVFPCIHHKDDTNKILEKIISADILVFATPIYWGGPHARLRTLMEKMTALENNADQILKSHHREPLEGKPFAILASQDSEGASLALSQTTWAFSHMGMFPIPFGLIFEPALLERPIAKIGLRLMGVRKFEWIDNSIRLAARNLVGIAIRLRGYAFDDYQVKEPKT